VQLVPGRGGIQICSALTGDYDDIALGRYVFAMLPEPFANASLHAIPDYGVANATARCDPEPRARSVLTSLCCQQHECGCWRTCPVAGYTLEVSPVPEPIAAPEALVAARAHLLAVVTARRRRPLARRRFSTLRPACVFIRARKPWVRRRRIRLG
jgi:hypothetical protein